MTADVLLRADDLVRSFPVRGLAWHGRRPIVRALNEIGYDGPLAVDWRDDGMEREYAAAEACRFVQSLGFPAPESARSRAAFRGV